jgi:hypothetical protein
VAIAFWNSEGILLVEFADRGATINSDGCVQTSKKLKQRIGSVGPNKNTWCLHNNIVDFFTLTISCQAEM